jgi:rRNA-processing protein FCF1
MLLVDAANVVGARPNGWWHDRPKAARDLVAKIRSATAASRLASPVIVVLEGAARRGVGEGIDSGVEVVHAAGAGDDALVAIAAGAQEPVVLVSADRALRERARASGADAVGPRWLLDRLTE